MNKPTAKLDTGTMQSITDTLLAARKNNLKEVLEIAHRLETVSEQNDIQYINDSKSTNLNATLYSFECMSRPVVWLLSASDLEQDYNLLSEPVAHKVTAIVCILSEQQKPTFDFKKFGKPVQFVYSLEEGLNTARSYARPGDAILFSPAHPSELCYENYKARGIHFRNLVQSVLTP